MHSRLTKIALSAVCTLAPLAAVPAGPAQAQGMIAPAQDIVLSIGRGELVNVPGSMTDVFVANDQVADVQVKSQRQLFVMGLAGGETTIYASNAGGDIIWSANVRVGSNIDSIDQMLALAMPSAKVNISTMGSNTVLLTGTVAAPEDAAEAERLVSAFVGEQANVISRLRMATPLQVNLRVRFAEVSRSLVRSLNANITTVDGGDGFQFGLGRGRRNFATSFVPGRPLSVGNTAGGTTITPQDGATTLGGAGRFLGLDIAGALDLAETEGLVTTLAQPNLTALSGETAEFLAGGEFPILVPQALGTNSIEYKKYGVSLSYAPTVLANGRISMRVRPEVSELSTQGAISLGGNSIPGLTTRRAETTIELGSGESFMIAGLLSNNATSVIDKTPGVGDLPILGNLFRSNEFQRGETELVIVVTPYLVKPVNDSEIRLPTDGYASPNFGEQVFLNRRNAVDAGTARPMPRAAGEADANPSVSAAEQSDAMLAEGAPGAAPAQSAAAARPGFSLN
ncbi:type II and III secretion system protein family protein [Aurantiacibacter xanthus]|uniref:Type II and III secretion system protein family protein n=2 Tax=Aurantiacibacter xanthus TaxID=1784712 RepID=A0A3A1P1X4_9SPHN|nr:type II and III secretion system protein family protein [Aurantiacibacter xanthus]RIV83293.1 type II and III secretion system protein family protein [Aurantiacibacter xanthus]